MAGHGLDGAGGVVDVQRLAVTEFDIGDNAAMQRNIAKRTQVAKVRTPEWSRELVSRIAMDIGKEVVHHIATMYPKALEGMPETFKLSVRNTVHNEIMAAIKINDEQQIIARLDERKKFRRKLAVMYRNIRA